ncbi:nitrous oxide reductase family maturation protein NosD [Paenibacillus sp. NPDC057967]|uniref:right-handed parallel beta-helix repeat-containing protein n=1 Tax=Paenibacillus sp. NPDC057967 TaxID=3346293 RepID=UPI0036D7FE63
MIPSFFRWSILILAAVPLWMLPGSVHAEAVSLQSIVDAADPGETIELEPGIYEGAVTLNKPLTVKAARAGEVILRNGTEQSALRIEANGVRVEGLRIEDEALKQEPTIWVAGSGTQLDGLYIRTGADGIAVRDADDGEIARTTIEWAVDGVRTASKGNGIDLYNAHRWRMTDNRIADVHDGIYMENSDDAVVSGNLIERSRYGVHCMYTEGTVIERNEGKLNVTGAMVMTARRVEVRDNRFSKQSENVNSQGILLYDAHDSVFAGNIVEGNRVGFYVEQSTGNRLEQNRVSYNFIGLQLISSSGNSFSNHMFLGNVSDAQARDSHDNDLTGNYWDSFRGVDADGDGYSDLTYAINPFFQSLTQKRAPFQLFFQSPGMVFLEELFQTDRANWSYDGAPLMVPPSGIDEQSAGRPASGMIGLGLLLGSSALFYRMRRQKE